MVFKNFAIYWTNFIWKIIEYIWKDFKSIYLKNLKSEKNNLLMKVVTPKEAQDAVKENALLKQRVAELEAMKDKRGAKTQNESDNTEK